MCKYYIHVITIVAILVGVFSLVLGVESARYIVAVENFFGVMLPILAVGALLKYLFTCTKSKNCDKSSCDTTSSKGGCH